MDSSEQVEDEGKAHEELEEAIAEIAEHAKAVQRRAKSSVKTHLSEEVHFVKSLISVMALLVVGLHSKNRNDRLYPNEWLSPTGIPDPDLVLGLGFCQLANYAYAIVDLIEKGLDTPARALVRSAAELGRMLTVIAHDRDVFQAYVSDHPEGDKKKWYELFSAKKIVSRLAKFDRELGVPEFVILGAREWEQESAEFFSQAIHHSFHSIVIGTQPSIPGTPNASLCLLGGPNGASRATLTHLLISISLPLSAFFRIVNDVHKFKNEIPEANAYRTGERLYRSLTPELTKWVWSKVG